MGRHTYNEIFQQPALWPTSVERVAAAGWKLPAGGVIFTGAGTSAYAAAAIAPPGANCRAVPTTDLLVDAKRHLEGVTAMISLARSGDSPESLAVVERVRALAPGIAQYAITCNENGKLARAKLDGVILLDPRTNDQSLVMTSSFSNLVLAGLCLFQPMEKAVAAASARANDLLPELDKICAAAAGKVQDRLVVLSSSPLQGWAAEAGLKTLEMNAGAFPVVTETFLGLRHGPMSFLQPGTFVLCLMSGDATRRKYESDLLRELRVKKIGVLAGIADGADDLFDIVIPPVSPYLPDHLRTPFEIIVPQLLGYHLSLAHGRNPDAPSPGGVINRVVQGVTIHPDGA